MNPATLDGAGGGAQPFFLPADPGERFCLFHPPAPQRPPRGAILYVHPFAEELNKSRRMAALQARAFAAAGYGVLQIDLYGCGDSSGDFGDARWPIWRQDLGLACAWLTRRVPGPLSLWGLRLGALLALDLAGDAALGLDRVILWHPVFKGKAHLDQFLRLRLVSQMLSEDAQGAAPPSPARQILAGGGGVEVAGYELTPELAADIDALDATRSVPAVPVQWFELAAPGSDSVTPAATRQAERWRKARVALSLHALRGVPFWAATESIECQALLEATTALCA